MFMDTTESGFSLIELTIVILVMGIILGGVMTLLPKVSTEQKINQARAQMKDIKDALTNYVQIYGHLPCPASLNAAFDTSTFGAETDCSQATAPGTTEIAGSNANLNIRMGGVPTRAINLPDMASVDPWGRRIVFIVLKNLATTSTTFSAYDPAGLDTVIINDVSNNRINQVNSTTNPNYVAYVLASYSETGNGGTNTSGTITSTCDATRADAENCNTNNIFIDSTYNTNPQALYDNIISWDTYQTLVRNAGIASKSLPTSITGFRKYAQFTYDALSGEDTQASTWNIRSINTIKFNNLSNGSLNANTITLGAGEYYIRALGQANGVSDNAIRIINLTDNVTLNTGILTNAANISLTENGGIPYNNNLETTAYCSAYLNTTHTVTIRFEHFTLNQVTAGLGKPTSSLSPATYFTVEIFEK